MLGFKVAPLGMVEVSTLLDQGIHYSGGESLMFLLNNISCDQVIPGVSDNLDITNRGPSIDDVTAATTSTTTFLRSTSPDVSNIEVSNCTHTLLHRHGQVNRA